MPAKKKIGSGEHDEEEGGVATLEQDESRPQSESRPHLIQEGHAEETDTAPVAEPMFTAPGLTPPTAVELPGAIEAENDAANDVANDVAPAVPPVAEAPVATPAVQAPVSSASAPAAPLASPKAPMMPAPPVARPTVRLEKSGPARPERPKVTIQPFVPKPAELQGPKVVREEKPDMVATPRRRVLPGQGGPTQPNALGPSTPRGGRGVKVTEGGAEEEAKKPATARRRGPRRPPR